MDTTPMASTPTPCISSSTSGKKEKQKEGKHWRFCSDWLTSFDPAGGWSTSCKKEKQNEGKHWRFCSGWSTSFDPAGGEADCSTVG
ncbi:hypothetical protein RchiOBHm_Chr1g0350801 [Rosa chinensis]|uniref:Uncharacterized protein n=1 Tax=Rosa chinensis TaxID=74649 RepID=A0A2P6SG52_ROSCH|nr:hypothetical protein RchiOBHm_Chr1g0350801 [Rosa chinensis]